MTFEKLNSIEYAIPGSGNLEKEESEMRDGYYERDSGIGDFEGQDSGNNHLNEPRAGESVDANFKSRKV